MEDLETLRQRIDEVDKKLIKLFEERMEIVEKVADYKKENNIPILNKGREEEVIKKNLSYIEKDKYRAAGKELLIKLMEVSRTMQAEELFNSNSPSVSTIVEKLQYESTDDGKYKASNEKLIAGFQGVPGSFSEEALIEYFGQESKAVCFNEFEDVFAALQEDKIDYGIVPIENSSTGGITDVYDLLGKYGFYIVGEKCIRVSQYLMGIKGSSIEDIKEVYSHPQGFQQSSIFLKRHPQWRLIPYYNTAKSAKLVSEKNDASLAAVASKKAAELYNLDILTENINFNTNNYTRFIVISKRLEINKECNKISIAISLPHKAGALYNILRDFAENNLNLLKIESRPKEGGNWEYFFYIDFQGNMEESFVREAVRVIEEKSSYFKFLGNYKADCFVDEGEKEAERLSVFQYRLRNTGGK